MSLDDIFVCCEGADLAKMRLLLHSKNVNQRNSQGMTPLAAAIKSGSLPAVRFLITLGADINAFNSAGQTPLFLACWYGHLPLVRELIAAGADLDAQDRRGWTPLIIAVHQGMKEIVEELISSGADIDRQDMFGRRAIDRAKNSSIASLLKPSSKSSAPPKPTAELHESIESRIRHEAEEAMTQASSLLNTVAKEAEQRFTAEIQDYAKTKLREVYKALKDTAFEAVERTMREAGMDIPLSRLGNSEFNYEFPDEEINQDMEDTSDFIAKLLAEHYDPLPLSTWQSSPSVQSAISQAIAHAEDSLSQLCEDGTSALASGFILQLQDSLSAYARKTLEQAAGQLERSLEAVIQARVEEIVAGNARAVSRSGAFKSLKPQEPPESIPLDSLSQLRSPQAQSLPKDMPERLYKTTGKPLPASTSKGNPVPRTAVSSTLKQFLSSEVKFDF